MLAVPALLDRLDVRAERLPTVKTHLGHLYDKLGVKDRAAAVATAYDRGLLSGQWSVDAPDEVARPR